MIDFRDLYWAAGFLDGEGCFTFEGAPRIIGTQKSTELLLRLQNIFGGKVYLKKSCPVWAVTGILATSIMMTLFSLMSIKRKKEILKAISLWKERGTANKYKKFCKYGHPFDENNTYRWKGRTSRSCKICRRNSTSEYQQRKRNKKR